MAAMATTRMSTKGQVVIPEDIRKRMGLKEGDRFVVVGEDDVLILKTITPPAMSDFDGLVRAARRQAREAGMTREDLDDIVTRARKRG